MVIYRHYNTEKVPSQFKNDMNYIYLSCIKIKNIINYIR